VALRLEQKKAIVAEVSEVAANAISAVAADYRGLTVSEMNELRVQARNSGVYLRVVQNNLARRAVVETAFECMQDAFVGPLILAFSSEEPAAAARLFKDFSKKHEKFSVTVLSIDGQLFSAKEIDRVATLPTKDEAIAQLMSVMKAPIEKFVRTLAEPHAKLVRTIAAIGDKKKAAGE